MTLRNRRRIRFPLLVMLLALPAVWPAACTSATQITDGEVPCDIDFDCYDTSQGNYHPGTLCINYTCRCPLWDEGYVECCPSWEPPDNCNRNCYRKDQCVGYVGEEDAGTGDASTGDAGPGGEDAQPPPPECESPADCPQPPDVRCGKATCTAGVCGIEWQEPGPVESQQLGDCQTTYCDPTGKAVAFNDPSDWYDDGNECTIDYCIAGQLFAQPHNGACSDGGHCFLGECVECATDDHCKGLELCDATQCVPINCADGMMTGDETDIDCGGSCAPCGKGADCGMPSDCISGVCPSGTCLPSVCDDHVKNNGETDLDCGGPSCAPCADGLRCALSERDCVSGVCWKGICQQPTCFDGKRNGAESGTDCGGSCDPCG